MPDLIVGTNSVVHLGTGVRQYIQWVPTYCEQFSNDGHPTQLQAPVLHGALLQTSVYPSSTLAT